MARNIIVLGDTTTHNGTVVSAWGADGPIPQTIDGIPVACIGDKVTCPKCRGTHTIVSGAEGPYTMLAGRQIAREGDEVSDGSKLVSKGQSSSTHGDEGSGVATAAATTSSEVAAVALAAKGIQTASATAGISAEEAQMSAEKKESPAYDEQVRILYRETNEPAKNVKYRLTNKTTGKTLVSGRTDENGLTERVSTDKPEEVRIFISRFNLNTENEDDDTDFGECKTNDTKDSEHDVKIWRGRIFFDIRYVNSVKDKAQSFIKAAETQKRKAESRGFDKNKGDLWWSFEVTTECDINTSWQKIHDLQQEVDMEVEEGHLFTHASKSGPDGDHSGLEFATIGCTEDGTLTFSEIEKFQKLKWSNNSTLFLYGCRTGLPVSKNDSRSIADIFFSGQNVKIVKALTGYGYFSYSATTYQAIADNVADTRDIYLLAYKRALNVNKLNSAAAKISMEFGDGSVMPLYIRVR